MAADAEKPPASSTGPWVHCLALAAALSFKRRAEGPAGPSPQPGVQYTALAVTAVVPAGVQQLLHTYAVHLPLVAGGAIFIRLAWKYYRRDRPLLQALRRMPPPDERTAEQIKELLRPKFWQAFQSAVMVTLPFGMVEYALAAKLLPAAALTNQPLLLFRTIGSLVVYGTAFSHVYAAWFDADAETGL